MKHLAQLRDFLKSMEDSSSLASLPSVQRDVYYAATLLADEPSKPDQAGMVSVDSLLNHRLVTKIARPTVYRAIQALIEARLLQRIGSERSGLYRVLDDII